MLLFTSHPHSLSFFFFSHLPSLSTFLHNFSKANTTECEASCAQQAQCIGYSRRATSDSDEECCLYSEAVIGSSQSVANMLFYRMPQCQTCKDGYVKSARECLLLPKPPLVNNGNDVLEVYLPVPTPAGTDIATIIASAESAGEEPLTFALSDDSGTLLTINASTGVVTLAAAFTKASSVKLVVTDSRSECLTLSSNGVLTTVDGGCSSSLVLVLQVAAFLNCPTPITTYAPPGEDAEVDWIEPSLPFYLGSLLVTRDLGGATTDTAPFRYPLGHHQVVYTAVMPGNVGSVHCAFDIDVNLGIGLDVTSVADVSLPRARYQYLLVEEGVSNDGAKLPAAQLPNSTTEFSLGLRQHSGLTFTVKPQVRVG